MKHLKLLFIICLILPIASVAENFNKVFVGIAGKTPIKIQITNDNNSIRAVYDYGLSFDNSYIPNLHYLSGSQKGDVITLNDEKQNTTPEQVVFLGKLTRNNAKGILTYQINGKWHDPVRGIYAPVSFVEQTFLIDNNAWLVNQFSSIENNKDFYTLQLSYPEIKGMNISATSQKINTVIKGFIQAQTKSFINQVNKNNKTEESPGKNSESNTLTINHVVTASTPKILSIRFQMDTYFSHAAHPSTTFASMNFDPKSGNLLKLADLFQDNPHYLTTIENIIRPEVIKKLYPNSKTADANDFNMQWVNKGTAPKANNYQVWNIYNDNLVVTFNPYQVAAYVFGPQTLLIPLNKLGITH